MTELETRPEVLRHLRVVANNLAFVRDDRIVIPCQLRPSNSGQVRPADVLIRNSRAVQAVMKAAASPIAVSTLMAELEALLSGCPAAEIESMLAELVARRALITNLHPPMDVVDPLGHLIDVLTEVKTDVEQLPMLRAVADMLSHHRESAPGRARDLRCSAVRQMADPIDRPEASVAVDLRLDCTAALPYVVAREATAAAAALVQLTPRPSGSPAWQVWHRRFLDRWGIGAVVPLREVVNPDTGLGYPAGYLGSPPTPARPFTARDGRLLRWAQRAALDGGEIVLDDAELATFEADADQPPHTELRFSVHSSSTEAIDRGDFTLVVVSAARQAGTTGGRFLHLFEPEDRDRMVRAFSELPTLSADAALAQVVSAPLSPRAQNLARTLAVLPAIPVADYRRGDDQIRLDDLAVSGDAHRLYLVSLASGRVVEPVMLNALEFRRATHPLARFLCEISTARTAACLPFSWGAASGLPFLPRVYVPAAPASGTAAAAIAYARAQLGKPYL